MKIHELCSGLHKLGITVPTDMWNIEETYFSNSKSEYWLNLINKPKTNLRGFAPAAIASNF